MTHSKTLLGKKSEYPDTYSPDVLQPIPRQENRRILGLGAVLPFQGEDIWTAYELTWLDGRRKPRVATAEIRVPVGSANIIESKSMKLYLNSFSMSRFEETDEVRTRIADDLTQAVGADVGVRLAQLDEAMTLGRLPGDCIDELDVECAGGDVDAAVLECEGDARVSEELHSNLLRSLCPVTDQPDMGSVLIRYTGRQIDRNSLLQYIVSYRNHKDFHESCVERIFLDIKKHCEPEALSVYARYNRRGGIDINPFRSDFESTIGNIRLVRQ